MALTLDVRAIFAMVAALLVGCAGVPPTRTGQVTVSARHVSDTCRPDDLADEVAIHIKNDGATPIGFPVEPGISKTSLGLYPTAFAFLGKRDGALTYAYWHLTSEEFDPPTRLAFIGPGDSADFSVPIGPWSAEERSSEFAIRVWDTDYHPHDSAPFWLCQPRDPASG